MKAKTNPDWPVLRAYDREHLARIALPLGGIETGTVSLGGRGDLRDWEVVNRPAKGFTPDHCFFALWAKAAGGQAITRAIEGAIPEQEYEGSKGSATPNHGWPRFRRCSFAAAYPLGQVMLSDPDVPLDVRIEAFNPLIPGDADASGIPAAVLRFVLINRTAKPVAASVCGNMLNFIGADGSGAPPGWGGAPGHRSRMKRNHNEFRRAGGVRGIFMHSRRPETLDECYGTLALATTAGAGVTYRTAWAQRSWGGSLLDFWDDFSADGRLGERRHEQGDVPTGSLAVRLTVPPRSERAVTFLIAWRFPNRVTWTPVHMPKGHGHDVHYSAEDRVGNYYAGRYADAWDVAERTAKGLKRLERRTVRFVRALSDSDLPPDVKEAALFNLSTLRSQTCFRTADGNFYGWEGCHAGEGCCHGSCTHVWNYEQATAFLFGELARSMREVEFLHATGEDGHMCFRVNLPLSRARDWKIAAADGQMGCLMKLYRDWRLSGDEELLGRLWPSAKKAMEFCWVPGGWDADRDGVMEGCQHNTMDVEYYGPNGQMGGWYLGALRACEEMARHVGDDAFAATCRDLFERGSRWLDAHLFNGEYYEHEVRPPGEGAKIAEGLRHGSMGARDLAEPELQLGPGCLVDQLVGQYMAHTIGLGYLLKPAHVRRTLRSIYKYNFQRGFYGHFNNMRSFVLNDERAMLMATYPRGGRPEQPFPYAREVMTGFEYAAAVGMLQEGQTQRGLECIRAIRDRYDGARRNPFDEAECGHHYARAMASWAAVLTLTGFRYSSVDGSIEFAATDGPSQCFWSNGAAWGTFRQKPGRGGVNVELTVIEGSLRLRRLTLTGVGSMELPRPRSIAAGKAAEFLVQRS